MPRRVRKVLFHVGAVPTASWLVQRSLAYDLEFWRTGHAYGLPNAVVARDIGRGNALVKQPDLFAATLHATFADSDVDVVIGSRELLGPSFGGPSGSGLYADAEAAIVALAEATRPYRCMIALTVCPQAQLLDMLFERELNAGRARGIGDWLSSVDLHNLSWLPLLHRLTSSFGKDGVTVHQFEATDSGYVSFLRHFFAQASLELGEEAVARTPPRKPRLSDKGLRLASAAGPLLASGHERADLLSFLQGRFSELDGPSGSVLTREQRDALHERYGDELDLLLAPERAGAGSSR